MRRFVFVLTAAALTALGVSGCATKNYVRNQTAPLVNHAGELDAATANNSRNLQSVDERAQAGIRQAQGSADQATKDAQQATQQADAADTAANDVEQRANSLDEVVKGLDNYHQVAKVSVNFAFNKSVLTRADKQKLDNFAGQLGSTQSYILEVTGGTDTTGPAQYNYELSNRRADAVVQYLAAKYNVPARRFYLIGIGKDVQVAPDNTAAGRRKNRRVEVQLLSNRINQPQQPQETSSAASPAEQ